MNTYRDQYLSSEHWFGLKTRAMQHYGCRCAICGKADIANDVHHVKYKHLRDVELNDLRVLCRGHHDMVHQALDRHPQIFEDYKHHSSDVLWALVLKEMGVKPEIELPERPVGIRKFRHGFMFERGNCGYKKIHIDTPIPWVKANNKKAHPGEFSHVIRTNIPQPRFKAKRWKAPPIDIDKLISRPSP